MEKSNKASSKVETRSNNARIGYFERAGSFGVIAIMSVFYTALIAIFILA